MKQIINEQIVVPKITASIVPDRSLFWKKDDEEEKRTIQASVLPPGTGVNI